ncbi:hypothetical protein CVU37_04110 [candidate division BRC1 bacterium HGW-BRC1-1]|jgi:hypothetical protein|nr:MAG: hypothetical protein CVU37_04110 [candidate division BRC1 bacterium HGW-BRC1-1]
MRLSEERITFIAHQIAEDLVSKNLVKFGGSLLVMEAEIARVIASDLKIEEEIDREVVEMIDSMKRAIPQGSAEWQAIYSQKKEEIARRRNYIY